MSKWPDDNDNKNSKFIDCKNCEQSPLLWWKNQLEYFNSEQVKALTDKEFRIYSDILNMLGQYFDCWNPGALKIGQKIFSDSLSAEDYRTRKVSLETLAKSQLVFVWRELGYMIIYCPYFEKITKKIAEDRIKKRKNPAGSRPPGTGDLLARCKMYAPGLY